MLAVFKKAFRDSQRTTFGLSIAFVVYALLVVSFYPAVIEKSDSLDDLIESYPDEFLALLYGDADLENISVSAPSSFIHSEYVTWMMLILGVVVIVQVFNGFTNAERNGTMDVMLSLPLTRREVLLGRFFSLAVSLLIVLTASFSALAFSTQIWPEFNVSIDALAGGIYGAFFLLMVVAAFTCLLVSVIPSRWRFAGAIAYLFLIGSYLLYGFSTFVGWLSDIRPLLIFNYYNARNIIDSGVNISHWVILSVAMLVNLAIAWWYIDRKEIAV